MSFTPEEVSVCMYMGKIECTRIIVNTHLEGVEGIFHEPRRGERLDGCLTAAVVHQGGCRPGQVLRYGRHTAAPCNTAVLPPKNTCTWYTPGIPMRDETEAYKGIQNMHRYARMHTDAQEQTATICCVLKGHGPTANQRAVASVDRTHALTCIRSGDGCFGCAEK